MLREATPGAIVLDLDLETFDAFELMRLIGGSAELRSAPLVALSSRNDFDTFEKANRLGATEFVTKPLPARGPGRQARSGRRRAASSAAPAASSSAPSSSPAASSRRRSSTQALVHQRADGGRLGEVLVREGIVAEQDLVTALAGQMRIGVADSAQMTPEAKAMGLLPRDFIVRHRLMPLRVDDNGNLILAMTNPLDVISIDEVSMRTGKRVVPVICTESGFDEAVGTYFSMRGKLQATRAKREPRRARTAARARSTPNIVEIVDQLLADATAMDASDIHLEPREDSAARALPHRRRAARAARLSQGPPGRASPAASRSWAT